MSAVVVLTGGGGDGGDGGDGGGDGFRSSDELVVELLSTIVRLMVTLAPSTLVVCAPPPEG